MKHNIYVVYMYRWGDRECHSYVLGVYNKKNKAIEAARDEEHYRGGKYTAECIEYKRINKEYVKSEVIISLQKVIKECNKPFFY